MSFVSTQCPTCLKSIQVPTELSISKCMYCGANVHVPVFSSVAPSVSLSNLLGMARTASLGGNFVEAESYYNRVLELDPRNSEAWLGKGKSAGWQSSINNIRTREMILAFDNAIDTTDEANRPHVEISCAGEMNELVTTLYEMAHEHMMQFAGLDGIWDSFVSQSEQLINSLDVAVTWDIDNTVTHENIVFITEKLIEGTTFRDPYDDNILRTCSLAPAYEKLMRERFKEATQTLKALDPSYKAPALKKKKSDACFVVTATMGDEYHPNVTILRRFRAEILAGTLIGDALIAWYSRHGPSAARVVRKSVIFRALSYCFIVFPAACVASILLSIRGK